MELADFELERLTYEVRFPKAFAIWDSSGAITEAVTRELPSWDLSTANPGRIALVVKPNSEISIEIDKALVIVHWGKRGAEDITPIAQSLTKSLVAIFNIQTFLRVGTRAVYRRAFPTVDDATKELIALEALKLPEGKFFGLSGQPKLAGYNFRWESDAHGVTVRLFSETTKFEFNPPPLHTKDLQSTSKDTHHLSIDIDYYTVKPVLPDQLRADEWLKNVIHMINRDTKNFLKGR